MPLSLDHVALPAFDAASTVHFYTEILGLPLVEALSGDDWGGRSWLMMVFGLQGGTIVLCALRGAQRPGPDDLPRDIRHCAIAATTSSGWPSTSSVSLRGSTAGGARRCRPTPFGRSCSMHGPATSGNFGTSSNGS